MKINYLINRLGLKKESGLQGIINKKELKYFRVTIYPYNNFRPILFNPALFWTKWIQNLSKLEQENKINPSLLEYNMGNSLTNDFLNYKLRIEQGKKVHFKQADTLFRQIQLNRLILSSSNFIKKLGDKKKSFNNIFPGISLNQKRILFSQHPISQKVISGKISKNYYSLILNSWQRDFDGKFNIIPAQKSILAEQSKLKSIRLNGNFDEIYSVELNRLPSAILHSSRNISIMNQITKGNTIQNKRISQVLQKFNIIKNVNNQNPLHLYKSALKQYKYRIHNLLEAQSTSSVIYIKSQFVKKIIKKLSIHFGKRVSQSFDITTIKHNQNKPIVRTKEIDFSNNSILLKPDKTFNTVKNQQNNKQNNQYTIHIHGVTNLDQIKDEVKSMIENNEAYSNKSIIMNYNEFGII